MTPQLGAGYVNSWIESYTAQDVPCIQETTPILTSTFSNCVIWLVVGLIIGSLQFEKKRDTL